MPLIVIQWLLGLDILAKRWKVWLPGILIPTLYLTAVDALAIGTQSWTVNGTQATGALIPLLNSPIEEGIFFLVTDTFIVQGLILLMDHQRVWHRVRRLLQLVRRGPRMLRPGKQAEDAPKSKP